MLRCCRFWLIWRFSSYSTWIYCSIRQCDKSLSDDSNVLITSQLFNVTEKIEHRYTRQSRHPTLRIIDFFFFFDPSWTLKLVLFNSKNNNNNVREGLALLRDVYKNLQIIFFMKKRRKKIIFLWTSWVRDKFFTTPRRSCSVVKLRFSSFESQFSVCQAVLFSLFFIFYISVCTCRNIREIRKKKEGQSTKDLTWFSGELRTRSCWQGKHLLFSCFVVCSLVFLHWCGHWRGFIFSLRLEFK